MTKRERAHHSVAMSVAVTILALIGSGAIGGCDREAAGPVAARESDPDAGDRAIRHVILISVDTLRADHLGCYGHPFVKTPNIDRLASEGVVFEQHVSAAPTTLSSHTSLMTGTYPHTHGVPRNEFQVHEDNVMLAEVLDSAGFTTAAFIGAIPLHSRFNFAQGFEQYDERFDVLSGQAPVDQSQRSAARVNEAVFAWLDQAEFERLFLFVHYFDVHWPYSPPAPYDRMYRDDNRPMRGSLREIQRVRLGLRRDPAGMVEESRILDALYCGEISYTDHHIGVFLDDLKRRGVYEDALIILTSDHGEAMNEHWEHWNHGYSTYETTVHTPLIIRQPGGRLGGTRYRNVVSNIDVMPTLLSLLGLALPQRSEGKSFAPLLDGEELSEREPVFAEATKPEYVPMGKEPRWGNQENCRAVRSGRWKFIRRPAESICELYDLESDPGERMNLLPSESEETQALAAELAGQLAAWDEQADPLPFKWEVPDHVRELMNSLGYVLEQRQREVESDPEQVSATCP